jgi:hypothetical protein
MCNVKRSQLEAALDRGKALDLQAVLDEILAEPL